MAQQIDKLQAPKSTNQIKTKIIKLQTKGGKKQKQN